MNTLEMTLPSAGSTAAFVAIVLALCALFVLAVRASGSQEPADRRRRVILSLTRRGESLLARLSTVHRDELRRVGPHIESLLSRLRAGGDRARPASRRKRTPAAGD